MYTEPNDKKEFLSRISGFNCDVVTVSDFSNVIDYTLYPHVVFDGTCTFNALKNIQLRPLLESSKIVVLGA